MQLIITNLIFIFYFTEMNIFKHGIKIIMASESRLIYFLILTRVLDYIPYTEGPRHKPKVLVES